MIVITHTLDIGAEVSLNNDIVFTKKELGLSKYLPVPRGILYWKR